MIKQFVSHLENRDILEGTDRVWSINDVSEIWRDRVRQKVISDGYYFAEDGTAYKEEL